MAAKPCDQWHHMWELFVPHGQTVIRVKFYLDLFSHFREEDFLSFFLFSIFFKQYGCWIMWSMMSSIFFFSVDHFIPGWPSIFILIRCRVLHMQLWHHNEGTYDVIKKSHLFPIRSTCCVPSFYFFLGAVSDIEVQSFSVFQIWLAHQVIYDVIIIIETFCMSSRSYGQNWVNRISGCGENRN